MSAHISVQYLIQMVEERPVLWDRRHSSYKNKTQTRTAWLEICEVAVDGYNEMSEKEQNEICKDMMRKWSNIRDSYVKSMKRNGKRYIYTDNLHFLPRTEEECEEVMIKVEQMEAGPSVIEEPITKRLKSEEFEEENKSIVYPNRHLAFFQGILPSLEHFHDDDVIDFQMGVLQLISNIKKRRTPHSM